MDKRLLFDTVGSRHMSAWIGILRSLRAPHKPIGDDGCFFASSQRTLNDTHMPDAHNLKLQCESANHRLAVEPLTIQQ